MNKYLIFRTDRIGDFLLSAILIKSIKRNDKNASIFIVASKKNYHYIKNFNFINEVYELKNNILDKFRLIKTLRKHTFKTVIIHDGKRRSKIINFFLKRNEYFIVDNNNIKNSHFYKIKNIIKLLNFNFHNSDLNFLDTKTNSSSTTLKEGAILLHFDEKWSNKTYISKYKDIEPSEDQLLKFLLNLKKKSNELVITTGLNTPLVLKNVISKIKNEKIKLIENSSFNELENIVAQSKLLISCHGAISHLASAHNVKIIDIIDINLKNPYTNWTEHFRNYHPVYRKNFSILSGEINNLV